MLTFLRVSFCVTLLFSASQRLATAEDFPYYPSKLTNSKNGDTHDFPLGVLNATGRLVHGAREISIVDVGKGGPGEIGGLLKGDSIVQVEGKAMLPFSKELDTGLAGPQALLAAALDDGCAKTEPKLRLTVMRESKPVALEIILPPAPKYAKTFPAKCPKAEAYRQATLQWLFDRQKKDGTWAGHIGGDSVDYQVAYVGLALLSKGDPEYLPQIKKSVDFIRNHRIKDIDLANPKVGPKNWIAGGAAIFLAEYYLATEDESVLPDIQKCCDLMAKRVAPNGRMGHSFEITYSGGGLTIVNTHAHMAWALADKCGCKVDGQAWTRSLGEVTKAMTTSGAVGYSSGARGDNDAPARTGGMATALVLSGQQPQSALAMGKWLIEKNNRMTHAHTNCAMGLFFGTAGIKNSNPNQLQRHLQNWLPYLELCRNASGSASYFGSKRNIGGDEYLGLAPLANATVALMFASTENNLFLFGGRTKGWLNKVSKTGSAAPPVSTTAAPTKNEPTKTEPAATLPRLPRLDDPAEPPMNKAAELRTWKSLDGQFQVVAKFIKLDGQTVVLERQDTMKTISLPLLKLSQQDQQFIQELTK